MKNSFAILAGFVIVGGLFSVWTACNQSTSDQDIARKPPPTGTVSDSEFLATSGSLAVNSPDEFSWTIFARICRKASTQQPVGKNGLLTTNNAIWETWPTDEATYPRKPDPKNPPSWPTSRFDTITIGKQLRPITQQSFRAHLLQKANIKMDQHFLNPSTTTEEVRRNMSSFNYIVSNGLWYVEGLAAAFSKGTTGGYQPLKFPVDAVEIKAIWKPITKDSVSYYHWNYDKDGNIYGLVALHIMTKATPNWTWATWEWVGNPGRCDYLGCHDVYGVTPANVDPNKNPDSGYPPGQLTPQLVDLFKQYGLDDEWKNYRLKGSQIDWVDATGRVTLVGNSITEHGFVWTSSCITCHSYASFDAKGAYQPSVGFTRVGQSTNGVPLADQFWQNSTLPYGKPTYFQYDFVWGMINAASTAGSAH